MKYSSFLIIFVFLLLSCQSGDQQSSDANADATDTTEIPVWEQDAFREFYQKFHTDTSYQVNHITFPLAGTPDAKATETHDMSMSFKWSRGNWAYHKLVDFDNSEFEQKFQTLDDDLVTEYILHEKTNVGMMRRFAKIGDEWYLIYYRGMDAL